MLKHCGFVLGVFASIVGLGGAHKTLAATSDACTLITAGEVSSVLEIQSLPGKPLVAGSTKACIWSDTADASISNRRVTLSINSSTTAFDLMKSNSRIAIEAVSGIGDDAFYALPKDNEAPLLQVRKGDSFFTLRILNGLKSKPFTRDEVKDKEADLAKKAVDRL
jgi:hypothetical protein